MRAGHAFFLVGPTATGKSAVAQTLAERLGWAVLSADSMLVYRGMDVGTAKPTAEERSRVRYGGVDLVDPDRDFSVWDYRQCALQFLESCWADGVDVIVAGGSGLYVRSLTDGLDSRATAVPEDRRRWEALCRDRGVEALQEELRRCAPGRFAALADPRNPRRLIRSLEMAASEGDVLAPVVPPRGRGASTPMVGLSLDSARLAERIEARASRMFSEGLPDETRRLCERWPEWSRTARQAIGYAEALELLAGRCTRGEAEAKCASRTRRLAKRQRTWFRHQASVAWVELDGGDRIGDTAARVQGEWERHGPVVIARDQ